MNIKKILKTLKLNENTISMVLGAAVILVVGVLVVRYFRNLDTGTVTPSISTTGTETPEVGNHYVVKAEDNLWKIAEEAYGSGYNYVDIARENNLTNANQIEEGQELVIPDVAPMQATAEQVEQVNDQADAISGATYTVVQGDSLWNIAVRAYGDGYQWVKIASENNLVNPDVIHAGNVLTLPRWK